MKRAFVPLFGLSLTAAMMVAAALLYPRLPEAVPVHWGLSGQADGFVHKPLGPFVFPLIQLAITVTMSLAPVISPAKFRMEGFASSYRVIICAALSLTAWIFAAATAAELGAPLDPGRAALVGLGLMLAVIGNVFGKTTPNFFIGVRTPWTIASPEVWRRTNRAAAWVMVMLGALVALGAVIGAPFLALIGAIIAVGIGLVAYSYILYRRIEPRERAHEG
jgi:uncharacterized membrane protein